MDNWWKAGKKYLLLFLALVCIGCMHADVRTAQGSEKNGKISIAGGQDSYVFLDSNANADYALSGIYQGKALTYSMQFYDYRALQTTAVTVKSANSSLVSVSNLKAESTYFCSYTFSVTIYNYCDTVLTVTCGGETYTIRCRFFPKTATITGYKVAGKNSLYLNINRVAGADGYYVLQQDGKSGWLVNNMVKGNVSSVKVNADFTSNKLYVVCPAIQRNYGNYGTSLKIPLWYRQFTVGSTRTQSAEEFLKGIHTGITINASILSAINPKVTIASNGTVKIAWKKLEGATGYKVYSAAVENGTYKLLKNTGTNLSATDKMAARQTKYYRVEALCSENAVLSESRSVTYTMNKSIKVSSKKFKKYFKKSGSYDQMGAFADGNNYTLVYENGKKKILVEKTNIKTGKRKMRKVKVGSYDYAGGIFKLDDGNLYVVLGRENEKEKKDKVVIRVLKFNANWKKLGECKVKADASNGFEGIVTPFEAGNVDMSYSNGYAYLKTSRLMFEIDGVNHQSNIQFVINTRNMKYRCAGESYVSHSFAQYTAEKDGSLYQADLGDAYPRSMVVTITDNYTPSTGKGESTKEYDVIKFKGKTGENFVNASLRGLEVGSSNVLTCGTSAPHYNKIGKVKGWDKNENIYIGVTNRKTGKSHIVWLTKDNPNKQNYSYSVMNFFKINDNRFAILYAKEKVKKGTFKIYCTVIDNEGKVIKKKCVRKCSGNAFYESSIPVYDNGKIMWMEPVYKKKKVTEKWYGQKYTYIEEKQVGNRLHTVDVLVQ